MNRVINRVFLKLLPYFIILLFNWFLTLLYPSYTLVLIPDISIIISVIILYFSMRLSNIFNKIISLSWLIFFFLGILNINSIKTQTNFWNLEIFEASVLYLGCILVFTLSLNLFEYFSSNRNISYNTPKDFTISIKSIFGIIVLSFPILMLISIYLYLGFFPLLIGENIVSEMYEYDYGVLYNFKFISVYSLCFIVILFRKEKKKLLGTIYILIVLFTISIDGKRFVLLLSILSIIPILIVEKISENYNKVIDRNINTPLIVGAFGIGISYILLNILRTGGDIGESITSIINNIPFGVEFKDYVHSYNTYTPEKIKGYSFEWSALGSFLNSTLLEVFGLNKSELYQMGSQHAWMNMYNENFGIRLGIIAELYFAYGFFVFLIMILLAYLSNYINQKLIRVNKYFSRINYSILFGLFVLLINGQATVFFGCLTMMLYMIIFHFIYLFFSNNLKVKTLYKK